MYSLIVALIIGVVAMAQPTQHEKEVLKNDISKERVKQHETARDVFRGEPGKARADHNAAIAYHKKLHRDVRQMQHNDVQRRWNG